MIRRDQRAMPATAAGLDLAVACGQVGCPRRGRIDIEVCFVCADFEGFRDAPIERLICAANHDPDILVPPSGVVPR